MVVTGNPDKVRRQLEVVRQTEVEVEVEQDEL